METTTQITCPLCEQPIDGFGDAMVHPLVDGVPTHLHCLEHAASSSSVLPEVDEVIECLEELGIVELDDDDYGAKRTVLWAVLAQLRLGQRCGATGREE